MKQNLRRSIYFQKYNARAPFIYLFIATDFKLVLIFRNDSMHLHGKYKKWKTTLFAHENGNATKFVERYRLQLEFSTSFNTIKSTTRFVRTVFINLLLHILDLFTMVWWNAMQSDKSLVGRIKDSC